MLKGHMWIAQTSSLLSLDDMFFSLHALSGDLCLLAKTWLLTWCWRGRCLALDYMWLAPVKIQVGARIMSTGPAAWLSPHLWQETCREGWDWHHWVILRPAVHSNSWCCNTATAISSMRSPSREDFGTWVAMSERLAAPDVKAHWRPKTEIVRNYPCSSGEAPAQMTPS